MKNKSHKIQLLVPTDAEGQRMDKILACVPEIGSRSQASKLMSQGLIRLNGRVVKPSHAAVSGQLIEIDVPVIETDKLVPYDFPLDIIHEDDDLIIVNKPAGLVVHPACGHEQDTLVNALLHYTTDLSMGYNERRPGLVHRIDKDTSGLLVIAKHDEAQRFLAAQFQKKTTHRLYRAVTHGPFQNKKGTIRSFLRRHPENRKRVASDEAENGKLAITHYEVKKEHAAGLSLVELRLETGRTHQIRCHLSELGHPIAGDQVYGSARRLKSVKSVQLRKIIEDMRRFALHAAELGFVHPTTKTEMMFRVPWPADLWPLIEQCGFGE